MNASDIAARIARVSILGRKRKPEVKPEKEKKTSKRRKTSKPVAIPEVQSDPLNTGTEYSFMVSLAFSADFEGGGQSVSEGQLKEKLKAEVALALKTAVKVTANDYGIRALNVNVSPVTISSAMNDETSADER